MSGSQQRTIEQQELYGESRVGKSGAMPIKSDEEKALRGERETRCGESAMWHCHRGVRFFWAE